MHYGIDFIIPAKANLNVTKRIKKLAQKEGFEKNDERWKKKINFKINKKRSELNSRVNSLKQEISVLEKRNEELKTQTSLILEEEYLEKEAREKLNLKKPGEKVVTIIPEEKENNKSLYQKIEEISYPSNLKEEWQNRRQKMLSEKIDVTAFMVWFIENYPESANIMANNPDYQWKFK